MNVNPLIPLRVMLIRIVRWLYRNAKNRKEYLEHLFDLHNSSKHFKEALTPAFQSLSSRELFDLIVPVFPAGRNWDAVSEFQLAHEDEAKTLIDEADLACQHIIDLLGSGPVSINKEGTGEIDWHRDQKSGELWPPSTFYKFTKTVRKRGADIKWVRELSRCNHLVRLGQAYRLRKSGFSYGSHTAEEYAKECVEQILSWIQENPWPWGSNWQCTMDVGLRVLNWLLALDLISDNAAIRRDSVLEPILSALWVHGQHIYRNPERYPNGITTNHYIADLVAQVVLGISLPFFRDSDRWTEEGMVALQEEVDKQILPDSGVCFEASTGYHRLDLEMLLWPALVLEAKHKEIPLWLSACIKKMYQAANALLKSNGEVPAFGDQDNGRALNLFSRPDLYHEYLTGFCRGPQKHFPEALWSFGSQPTGATETPASIEIEQFSFPDVGWHGVRSGGWDLSIICGPVGTAGTGGHNHNDQLSFDLAIGGINIAGDPGTYVYTAYSDVRDRFRATGMHSTIWVESVEQCRFKNIVERECLNRGHLTAWGRQPDDIFVFDGYFEKPYYHRRRMVLHSTEQYIEGSDAVKTMERRPNIWWVLILHPGVIPTLRDDNHVKLCCKNISLEVCMLMSQENATEFVIEEIPYSRGYGSKENSHRIMYPVAED